MSKRTAQFLIAGILILVSLFSPRALVWARSATFDRETEFPNHFQPRGFEDLSHEAQIEALKKQRALLESAMQNLMRRLTVPVVAPGETKPKAVPYFSYVQTRIDRLSPGTHVMPSGGVVRSALGVIYDDLHQAYLADPKGFDPNKILTSIATAKEPVDAIRIRGVGSDFDVLFRGGKGDPKAMSEEILNITNSAETAMGARDHSTAAKRVLFSVGDAKEFSQQIGLSTSQGGSTIDFLAFDLEHGKFVEPKDHTYIVNDFLKGQYRYIAPSKTGASKDFQKQIVRGVRPLLELPFLEVANPQQFISELNTFIAQAKRGEAVDAKAIEQIGKTIRNARYSLGNNRLVRSEAGSLEAKILECFDALKARGLPTFPEYVDYNPLQSRNAVAKEELRGFPKRLLTPIDEVLKKHTTNGFIYHGTPSVDNAMAILRGGLYYSGGRNNQGGSAEGGGGYAGRSAEVAKSFEDGLTLELKVKSDPRLNALVWSPEVERDPFIRGATKKAAALKLDLHQYLQREHGIDLIVKNALLIQNTEVLDLGNQAQRVSSLINSIGSTVTRTDQPITLRLAALSEYNRLADYAERLGIATTPLRLDDEFRKKFKAAVLEEVTSDLSTRSGSSITRIAEELIASKSQLGDVYKSVLTLADQTMKSGALAKSDIPVTQRLWALREWEAVRSLAVANEVRLEPLSSSLMSSIENHFVAEAKQVAESVNTYEWDRLKNSIKDHPEIAKRVRSSMDAAAETLTDKLAGELRSTDIGRAFRAFAITQEAKDLAQNDRVNEGLVAFLRRYIPEAEQRASPIPDRLNVSNGLDLRNIPGGRALYARLQSMRLRNAKTVKEWFEIANFIPMSRVEWQSARSSVVEQNAGSLFALNPSKEEIEKARDYAHYNETFEQHLKGGRNLEDAFVAAYPPDAQNLDQYLHPRGPLYERYVRAVLEDPTSSVELKRSALRYIYAHVDDAGREFRKFAPYLGREEFRKLGEPNSWFRALPAKDFEKFVQSLPVSPKLGKIDSSKLTPSLSEKFAAFKIKCAVQFANLGKKLKRK